MKLKCNIIPMADESVIAEIEGEMWANSPNPIERLFAPVTRFFAKLIGIRKTGSLVLTDQRIIFARREVVFWFITKASVAKSVLPQGLSSVGYIRKGIFARCWLQLVTVAGEVIDIQLKGANEKQAAEYANVMYNAISR